MSNAGYDQSEPNVPVVSLAIVLTGIFLIAIFVWGIYYYKSALSSALHQQEMGPTMAWADNYRAKQSKELNSLKWVNKSKNIVKVPIDVAMDLTVKDYNK